MASKKNTTSTCSNLQTLKIGSRVRCTDDGVTGRITWANGVAVKVQWDDGEQVTWRRDSLAGRPIEILAEGEDQSTSAVEMTTPEQSEQIESPLAEPEAGSTTLASEQLSLHPEQSIAEPSDEPTATATASTELYSQSPPEPTEVSLAVAPEITLAADTPVKETMLSEPAQEEQKTFEQTAEQPQATAATAKRPRQRNPKRATDERKEKKLSALDAAARVLAEVGQPLNCQELIAAMAAKGYWTSPGGKTPAATLYSAILREITAQGTNSRFQKADRGKFSRNDAV